MPTSSAGCVARDDDGKPTDEIAILRAHGWGVFLVSFFVNSNWQIDAISGSSTSSDVTKQ